MAHCPQSPLSPLLAPIEMLPTQDSKESACPLLLPTQTQLGRQAGSTQVCQGPSQRGRCTSQHEGRSREAQAGTGTCLHIGPAPAGASRNNIPERAVQTDEPFHHPDTTGSSWHGCSTLQSPSISSCRLSCPLGTWHTCRAGTTGKGLKVLHPRLCTADFYHWAGLKLCPRPRSQTCPFS